MSTDSDRRHRFESITGQIYEPLYRYVRRRAQGTDVDDAMSDVLLVIWRRLEDVPEGRALPWAYGIARRVLANQRRQQGRHLRLVEKLKAQPEPVPEPDPAETGPDPELTAALDSLSDSDRELIRLWAWERLEPREIAMVLDLSINAATLRLSRARSKLATELKRQNSTISGHEQVEGTQEMR